MSGQKPLEWVSSLLSRFEEQLPVKKGPLNSQSRLLLEQNVTCMVNVSKYKFSIVLGGIIRSLQNVNAMRSCCDHDLLESQCIILDTIEQCLGCQTKDASRFDEATNVKLLLTEICQFLSLSIDGNSEAATLKDKTSRVLYALSLSNFAHVYSKISNRLRSLTQDSPDNPTTDSYVDLELIQHIHVKLEGLIRLLHEIANLKPMKKDHGAALLAINVEKAIWNWIDKYPKVFAELQEKRRGEITNEDLTDACDKFFDYLDSLCSENSKKRVYLWPLQMMLLILCPKTLEEIANAGAGAPCSPRHAKKKFYFDNIKKCLVVNPSCSAVSKQQSLNAACISGIKLCKAATYISQKDSANVYFTLVQTIVSDVKMQLFGYQKSSLFRSLQDLDVLIDCFVSCFRIQPHNQEIFKACFSSYSMIHHLTLVMSLYRIAIQPKLQWWPKIDLCYMKSPDMRMMFADTLNKLVLSQVSNSMATSHQYGTVEKSVHQNLASSGHMPLTLKESLQKVTKNMLRDRSGTSSVDDQPSARQLMLWIIRLICTKPVLFLNVGQIPGARVEMEQEATQSSVFDLLNGLCSLIGEGISMPEVAEAAMEALLVLHQPQNIAMWTHETNDVVRMTAFWRISSQLLFYVAQKLLHHQLINYPEILRWFRELLKSRNVYLMENRHLAIYGSNDQLKKQSGVKLETVAFVFLWSLETDAVLTAMSMFQLFVEEAEILYSPDEMPPEYSVHLELANCVNIQALGRAVLQKAMMANLRKVKYLTTGLNQAWEDTYRFWDGTTKYLRSLTTSTFQRPKEKTAEKVGNSVVEKLNNSIDEGTSVMADTGHRTLAQRRASRSNPEHEVDDIVNEWTNMTGFLCAIGGICIVYKPASPRMRFSMCGSTLSLNSRHVFSMNAAIVEPSQYCAVFQFLWQLLSLLQNAPERVGVAMQRSIKELLSYELHPALFVALFDHIKVYTDKFFDAHQRPVITDSNREFLEHSLYIMRNILADGCGPSAMAVSEHAATGTDTTAAYLSVAGLENILMTMARYVRHLDHTIHTITIKVKICNVIDAMMQRRDELCFRQEIRFRNKMVEYVLDWICSGGRNRDQASISPPDVCFQARELDLACMNAVASLLNGLPLQPEESDRGDAMEAKSQTFQNYFTLFMNILNECCSMSLDTGGYVLEADAISMKGNSTGGGLGGEHSISTTELNVGWIKSSQCKYRNNENKLEQLRVATVSAMSNLLAANIDAGLVHAITLGYHKDLRVRVSFMEVLTEILRNGIQFDTLNETVLADRLEQLVRLVTLIADDGGLQIVNALASVTISSQLDELARVLVTLFNSKHLLYELLWQMFFKEVEFSEMPATLFRGNTLASKIMGCCFKIWGSYYLRDLLQPLMDELIVAPDQSYEVDSSRLTSYDNLEENIARLTSLCERLFDRIIESKKDFPPQLRLMCHCLYQVVNSRFPTNGLAAVGMIIFLRFINPAIVSPYEHGLINEPIGQPIKRGLMLLSKILQSIANRTTFVKEQHMIVFNSFVQMRFETARQYFHFVTLNDLSTDNHLYSHAVPFVDSNVSTLHRLLWTYQEQIGELFSSSRECKAIARRMSTLLAQIGPPEQKAIDNQLANMELTRMKFEEIMYRTCVADRDEYRALQNLNIFYLSGTSKAKNPVFYYIARRFITGETNGDLLIFHILETLKPHINKPFEVVIDLTHAAAENKFKSSELLRRLTIVIPEESYDNFYACYVHNCNSVVRDYVRQFEPILSPLKNSRKLVFLDQFSKLNDYIDVEQQRLPQSTIALEGDLKVFNNGLKLWHKDVKVTIKVGPTAMQITTLDRQKLLGHNVVLNDIYYSSEIEEVCLIDDNNITVAIVKDSSRLSLIHNDCESIVQALIHIRTRYELSQPENMTTHSKIRAKDVPGTVLNMALLNLGSGDPRLRSAAYNLLCALSAAFDLKIGEMLLETDGLLIPANNTMFIKHMSEKLAQSEPHLTLELLEECIQGFRKSMPDLKHLCLEYMTPWLMNLPRFCKSPGDEAKRHKVSQILEKLITLTVEETDMYPSIQAKIWGNVGKISELLDMVLDGFVKRSITGGLGSNQAEKMADTTVALASSNVELVASNIVNRLANLLNKTAGSPQTNLEEHFLWDDIAILARYLLLLSFNNQLNVTTHLPHLFHFVVILVNSGPLSLRASIHGLVINIIHSLCTKNEPRYGGDTIRSLQYALTEFSMPKFYQLFGISQLSVKSVAATAFRIAPRSLTGPIYSHVAPIGGAGPPETSASSQAQDRNDAMTLTNLETITDALVEMIDVCNKDRSSIDSPDLTSEWLQMTKTCALWYNPALQPRALVAYGCLAKHANETDLKQLLDLLIQSLRRPENTQMIGAVVMTLTRFQPLLPPESIIIHRALFWVAMVIMQLEDAELYEHGLAMLEQNIDTIDDQGIFEYEKLEKIMMDIRKPLEWEFKPLDQQVGISFKHNFHFALVGYLLKGFRHHQITTVQRTVRVINTLLTIQAKSTKKDRLEVSADNLPYLVALLPFSEEVRQRCHLRSHTLNALAVTSDNVADMIIGPSYERYLSNATDGTLMPPNWFFTGTQHYSDSMAFNRSANANDAFSRCLTWKYHSGLLVRQQTTSNAYQGPPAERRELRRSVSDSTTAGGVPVIAPELSAEIVSPEVDNIGAVNARASNTMGKARKRSSRTDRESNILLDCDVLSDQSVQTLVLTVLATLLRNVTDEKEARILFEYLAEASIVFPKSFPVIYSLLDQRINQVLQMSHDNALMKAVLTIIQNMIPPGQHDPEQAQQHFVAHLQSCGFGGLWRFSGPFLFKPSAQLTVTAEVCTCLERLLGTLGEVPPHTPPPPSPRLPPSPAMPGADLVFFRDSRFRTSVEKKENKS